jgi:hypothetical protein
MKAENLTISFDVDSLRKRFLTPSTMFAGGGPEKSME